MSNIVRGIHRLDDELLFYREYEVSIADNKVMRNIISCEIKNLEDHSFYYNNKINIDLTFDVVLIYEYEDSGTGKKSYDIIVEKARKTHQFNMNVYDASILDVSDLKLINQLKKVKYNIDTSSYQDKFSLLISGLLDSYIVQEDVVTINNPPINYKDKSTTICEGSDSNRVFIKDQKQGNWENEDVAESLIQAEMNLCNVMNKVTYLYNTNNDLKDKLKMREKQIEYSEKRINTLKKSNQDLEISINNFNIEIEELKQKVRSQDEVIRKLEEDLSLKEMRLKEVIGENLKLKEDIQNMQEQTMQDNTINRIIKKVKFGV
jgi:septal ring factor EnvC (AmiA/AmiB activator)